MSEIKVTVKDEEQIISLPIDSFIDRVISSGTTSTLLEGDIFSISRIPSYSNILTEANMIDNSSWQKSEYLPMKDIMPAGYRYKEQKKKQFIQEIKQNRDKKRQERRIKNKAQGKARRRSR